MVPNPAVTRVAVQKPPSPPRASPLCLAAPHNHIGVEPEDFFNSRSDGVLLDPARRWGRGFGPLAICQNTYWTDSRSPNNI